MPDPTLPEALRAQIARSRIAISLAAAMPDMPLCMVNDAFCRLTGFDADHSLGRNCRFLQSSATPRDQIGAMSRFLADDAQDDGRFPVMNRTRDGRSFMNLVFMSKLRGGDGTLRFVIGSQFDVTASDAAGTIARDDVALSRNMADLRRAAGQFGLIMSDSTGLIARSISTLARITLRDE